MRTLLVTGELSGNELATAFQQVANEIQTSVAYSFGDIRIVLIVGRKFFFRSNDYMGATILAATNGTTQRIDLSSAGGGSGLLGIQWGAGNKFEQQLFDGVAALAQRHSFRITEGAAPPPAPPLPP